MTTNYRRYIHPPSGRQVRRLIALMTLGVGIPRLPMVHELLTFAPQKFGAPEVFGVLCVALGVALLVTAYGWRLTIAGRVVAGLNFALWVTLVFATTSSTSLIIDAVIAASLLVETGTMHDD